MREVWPVIMLAGAVVLIPLVPAFLLHRFLPSSTNVSGPFKGLSLRLKGAFAGYFVLALAMAGLVLKLSSRRPSELWTIQGTVLLGPDSAVPGAQVPDVLIEPTNLTAPTGTGVFELRNVPGLGDRPDVSFIQFGLSGYEPTAIPLNDPQVDTAFGIEPDPAARLLRIRRLIILKRAAGLPETGQIAVPIQDNP